MMDSFPLVCAFRVRERAQEGEIGVRDAGRGEAWSVEAPLWRMRTTDDVRAAAVIACISGPGHEWVTRLFRRAKCRRCGVYK
jgi:hypothetical protein